MSDDISITKMIHNKNSPAIDWGTVPQLKSVEFFVCTRRVDEIFHVHADFTAGQMLYLIRSMTQGHACSCLSVYVLPKIFFTRYARAKAILKRA